MLVATKLDEVPRSHQVNSTARPATASGSKDIWTVGFGVKVRHLALEGSMSEMALPARTRIGSARCVGSPTRLERGKDPHWVTAGVFKVTVCENGVCEAPSPAL